MAKKKVVKKKAESKELVAPNTLVEAGLNSAALAIHANYDMAELDGVKIDLNDDADLYANDILIPKVWLIQAMSELRKQKKADEGQFVDSQTGEILADVDQTLGFVVLKTFKRVQTFEMVQDGNKIKKEFVSSELMVAGKNEKVVYNEVSEGKTLTRREVIGAYVILEKDVMLRMNKVYVIDFAASSKYGGRKLISDIKTLGNQNLPSLVAHFKMTAHEENFNDGSAFVKDVNFGGYMPKDMIPFLVECRKSLDAIEGQIEIDDRDVINTETVGESDAKENVAAKVKSNNADI